MKQWDSHDQNLPAYGPYNKQYVGFSHVADEARGLRLDVDVLPGLYRRWVMDTRSITDSGARLWQARPDLMRFVYRYELSPGGKLYLETDFVQEGDRAAIRCAFVNDTALPQSVQADFCFSVRMPTFYNRPLKASEVHVPEGCAWVSAAEYAGQEGLTGITHDGFRLGEQPEPLAVKGCLMALPAGRGVAALQLLTLFLPVKAAEEVRCPADHGCRQGCCRQQHHHRHKHGGAQGCLFHPWFLLCPAQGILHPAGEALRHVAEGVLEIHIPDLLHSPAPPSGSMASRSMSWK